MDWIQFLTLIALVLVPSAGLSLVFQWLKEKLAVPEQWRAVILYAICLIVALAQQWLSGDILGIMNSLGTGSASAAEVFAFGSSTFALATLCYQKFIRPAALARAAAEEAAKV